MVNLSVPLPTALGGFTTNPNLTKFDEFVHYLLEVNSKLLQMSSIILSFCQTYVPITQNWWKTKIPPEKLDLLFALCRFGVWLKY